MNGATPYGLSSPYGLTPSQISQAYGINQISFNGTAGNGSAETIAIVDAYNDPSISGDLQTFDKAFSLPNPTLAVVNQSGGSSLPATKSNWIPEIALDVEWAHAAAPGANILLVEANTGSYLNLMQAVSYAAAQPGVVAVSMSWGGGEWAGEESYDSYLETTTGHPGVVFVAASGDAGSPVEYPACSPNVLAVGGTTLSLNSQGGYSSESGWSGSGGGVSAYEAQPSFQKGIVTQSSTFRTDPDVAFNADPNDGYAVCDSYDNGLSTPWVCYGGTSAAAPQWAGLIAIADQGRALAGESSFSNSTLMPSLYHLPTSAFHDITTGTSDGSPSYSAGLGYDLVTGLGTPAANVLAPDLVGGQASLAATHFSIASATTSTAGSGLSITVTALNASNQQVSGYTGTIQFSSTDGKAGLPANYTFSSGDAGSHTFTVSLETAGSQKITATDTSNLSLTGSDAVTVSPANVTGLSVSAPAGVVAGRSFSESVTALDAYGNVVTGYTGTVAFSSSDVLAGLPANYTFLTSDAGAHTFTFTLKTAGNQTLAVSDTSNAALTAIRSVSVSPAAASLLRMSGPSSATAGMSFTETITAFDTYGNVATGYTGTVGFTSTDSAAGLPTSYTFTSSDAGTHSFTVTLKTAGSQTVTAADTSNSGLSTSTSINLSAGTVSGLMISDPLFETAGMSFPETVTALDPYGNTVTDYTGTVHFTSTDPAAQLPGDFTFTSADDGSHSFLVALGTVGIQSITATDTANGSLHYSLSVNVVPGAASQLRISAPGTVSAGAGFGETVTVLDAEGNVVTGYTGTIQFSSSDSEAGLPANYTFSSADAGSHTFTFKLKTAGSQTIAATDTGNSSLAETNAISVIPGAAASLSINAPSTVTAGTSVSETVTALDAFGNVATAYTGTVKFTSSDPAASLPSPYTFTLSDSGSHSFTIALKTAGAESVSVSDAANPPLTASSNLSVSPAAASQLLLTGPSTATQGTSFLETVTAEDAYGNIEPGYTGTVQFACTDGQAGLPTNYTFTSSDAGQHAFSIALNATGAQTVSATDAANNSIAGSASVIVSPDENEWLKVTGPSTVVAGAPETFTVAAMNGDGTVAADYTGTVSFSSSDAQAGLPSNYTFTASNDGVQSFSIIMKTAGSQSITATDTSWSWMTGKDSIGVNASSIASLLIAGPSSTIAGSQFTETITAVDAYGNAATSYRGTVSLTTSAKSAVLPAAYTFTAADGGKHTFTFDLKTSGDQSITAKSRSAPAMKESKTMDVDAAPAVSVKLAVPASTVAGTSFVETITALDAYGNLATSYTGSIAFSSSDHAAILPASYTFDSSDNGVHSFLVTMKTEGTHTLSVTDVSNGSITSKASMSVKAAALSSFRVSGFPASITAGGKASFTVAALDEYGNVITGYSGTVQFTSSDPHAVLPAATRLNRGTGAFTAIFRTAGIQALSVSDVKSGVNGEEPAIQVNTAAAKKLLFIQQPTTTTPGAGFDPSVTVEVVDQYNNVVVTDKTVIITLTLHGKTTGAKLSGNSAEVVNGIATFTDLNVSMPGAAYTLSASSNSLTPANSADFTVL